MGTVVKILLSCALLFASPVFAADSYMASSGSKHDFGATSKKTPAPGAYKDFDPRPSFDPEKPAGGRLDVTIKVTSADMNIPDVNKEIRNKDWFDYAGFPEAR